MDTQDVAHLLRIWYERDRGHLERYYDDMGVIIDYMEHMNIADDHIDHIARKVIRGDYGDGTSRRLMLGGMYDAVQKRVNEMMAERETK